MVFYTLPECCHCSKPFAAQDAPVLLPCQHFIVCQQCLRSSHQLCFICNEAAADVAADSTLASIVEQLRQRLEQGYQNQAEDEALNSLNRYIAMKQSGQVPQSAVDISVLPLRSVDDYQTSDYWVCEMCQVQVPTTSFRCSSCNRANFQLAAFNSPGLPSSLEAIMHPVSQPVAFAQGSAVPNYSQPFSPQPNPADSRPAVSSSSAYSGSQVMPQSSAFNSQSFHPTNQVSPAFPVAQSGQSASPQDPPKPSAMNSSRVQPSSEDGKPVKEVPVSHANKSSCCVIV